MADDKVILPIEIETTEAEKSLKGIEKATEKSVDKMQKAFDGLKTAAVAALGFFAAKGIYEFFEAGIEGAVAQEQAMARLRAQMAATGEDTDAAAKAFNDLAGELESTTKFGDDAVLAAAALAKSYGISNDEAVKLTKAATDLASATGDTLEGAVEQLTASYSGNVKAVAKLVPEIKGLTKEQLAAGGAVDLLAKRFEGAAQKEILTYGGAVKQATNAFENFREAFGTLITQNKSVVAVINGVGTLFKNLQAIVERNEEAFTHFINFGVRALVVSLSVALTSIDKIVSAMGIAAATTVDFANIFLPDKYGGKAAEEFANNIIDATADMSAAMEEVNFAVDNFAVSVFEAGESSGKVVEKQVKQQDKYTRAVTKSADEVEKLRLEAEKYVNSLRLDAASPMEKIALEEKAAFDELELKIKEFGLSEAQAREQSFNITEKFRKKRAEQADKEYKELTDKTKKVADDMRALMEAAAANPIKFIIDDNFTIPQIDMSDTAKQYTGAGAGVLGKMLEGAAGAKALIASGAGAIGDALIPGIGGAVGGIVSKLAEGPEATKQFIKEFVEAIPMIMDAVAESIPVVVEVLVDTLINKGGAVRIGMAIARAMAGEAILKNLGKQMGINFGSSMNADVLGRKIAGGFVTVGDKLSATFTNFGSLLYNSLFKGFIDGAKQIVTFFATALSQVPAAFVNIGATIVAPIKAFFSNDLATLLMNAFTRITSIFDPIINFFRNFKIEIPGVTSGSGGRDYSKASSYDPRNYLNTGGIVYAANGFKPRGTDTVPAMLTPGEMVLNRGQQSELFNLANNGGGSGNAALLMQIIELLSQPQTTEVTAAVNGKAIADIVLQQSRQRARLSA